MAPLDCRSQLPRQVDGRNWGNTLVPSTMAPQRHLVIEAPADPSSTLPEASSGASVTSKVLILRSIPLTEMVMTPTAVTEIVST